MTVARGDCLTQWNKLWSAAVRVAALDHIQGDEAAMEPLQLLVGSLLYQRKALESFSDATLHEPVRQDPALLSGLLALPGDALVERATEKLAVMGGIHLASASLRLPTAILETIDARPRARITFQGLCSDDKGGRPYDWARKGCSKLFDDPAIGEHCDGSALTLPAALVLLLLFREDFGHGEEGRGKEGRWVTERKSKLDQVRRCRTFEAQRLLIEWGLKALEQPDRSTAGVRKHAEGSAHHPTL